MEGTWLSLIGWIAVVLGGGMISGSTTKVGVKTWYPTINKPSFTPPNWAFPVAWTILYSLMSVSVWLVYSEGGFEKQFVPLTCFLVQLGLNFIWSPLFFVYHLYGISLVDMLAMWVGIFITITQFYHVSTTATLLLVPYQLWVSFASVLFYNIWKLNKKPTKNKKKN